MSGLVGFLLFVGACALVYGLVQAVGRPEGADAHAGHGHGGHGHH